MSTHVAHLRHHQEEKEEGIDMRATARETEAETAYRLWCAITRKRPVTITYIDDKEGETVRTIEPQTFKQSRDGNIRIMAMCRMRKSLRSFRIDRIVFYTVHRGEFFIDNPFDESGDEITDWWKFTGDDGKEVGRLEIPVPTGIGDKFRYIYRQAITCSPELRAASMKHNGLGMRQMRRKELRRNAA